MKLFIEKTEKLDTTIGQAINHLLTSEEIGLKNLFDKIPKSKRKKLLARALLSYCVIDDLYTQIKFLIGDDE